MSRSFPCFWVGLSLLAAAFAAPFQAAYAEDALQPGEAFVTRFSGSKDDAGKTVIDLAGTVGSILDLRKPGVPPLGAQWLNEPQRSAVTAGEVGQVFGIALDDANPPNIYLTATSAFGLHRDPIDAAKWMEGMWGPEGGPGSVWKLDAATGYKPSAFAQIKLDGRDNSGAALGNIAFDPWNKQFFVSDLETGMIHRLRAADGSDLGHYDHGVTGRASFVDAATGAATTLPAVAFDPATSAHTGDCPSGDFARTPRAGISPTFAAGSGASAPDAIPRTAKCASIIPCGVAKASAVQTTRPRERISAIRSGRSASAPTAISTHRA
jgi:hypothetical protein